ncbi:MAG: FadR family transcriptional regulator [Desulfobacterales bacterium]|nr:FadR family transcriptional regulator [Desulfobacterales bacterium]
MFKQAKQSRVFQDIVEQIQAAILNNTFEPGNKLPCERELKEMFNTSRSTLREALRVLEQKGLIDIKPGVSGGAIVKKIDTNPITENLALLIKSGSISLKHLSEFRIKIEANIVELATKRAGKDDIKSMKALLKQAKKLLLNEDFDGFLQIDRKMHTLLGKISGNPVFQFIQKTIHDNIHNYYAEYLPMNKEIAQENYTDFDVIIEAIENKDSKKACEQIMDHVHRFNLRMQQKQNIID